MNTLANRIQEAKINTHEMNELLSDYLPYIKSEIKKMGDYGMEYEDRLSIAMLVFINCVRQYKEEKGSFLSFVSICIKNRFIDMGRKNRRTIPVIPLFPEEDSPGQTPEEAVSVNAYNKEKERRALAEEIDALNEELRAFSIDFSQLEKNCPKQARSREQCFHLAREILSDSEMKKSLLLHHRVPQSELAERFGISEKTIEKHRRYIVTVAVILAGNYPGIRSFLPRVPLPMGGERDPAIKRGTDVESGGDSATPLRAQNSPRRKEGRP